MIEQILQCGADVVAPIAQGVLELLKGKGTQFVIKALKEHFQTSQILPKALTEAFAKAVDTVEVALAGPSFYHKTAVHEFAATFRQEVLLPFLQQHGFKEEAFVKQCLQDLKLVKKQNLFRFAATDLNALAEAIGVYATQEVKQLAGLEKKAAQGLYQTVSNVTKPSTALAELLQAYNVIAAAAAMHFGLAVQKDEYLFRAFFLANQKGVKRELAAIQQQLSAALAGPDRQELEAQAKMLRELAEAGQELRYISKEVTARLEAHFAACEGHFGIITDHLVELRQVGDTVIAGLAGIAEQVGRVEQGVVQVAAAVHDEAEANRALLDKLLLDRKPKFMKRRKNMRMRNNAIRHI
jgi:hypothetical protein